eukprot:scaffold56243_cov77-Cyclotella_meneghiniana.AAC.6
MQMQHPSSAAEEVACEAFGIVIVLRPTMLAVVTNLVGRMSRWWQKKAVLEHPSSAAEEVAFQAFGIVVVLRPSMLAVVTNLHPSSAAEEVACQARTYVPFRSFLLRQVKSKGT